MKEWIRKMLLSFLGIDNRFTDAHVLINIQRTKIDEMELHHLEDYKFLAKRVNDLELEVFDCSNDGDWTSLS